MHFIFHKFLFKNHKVHHEIEDSFSISYLYSDPVEIILITFGPKLFGFYILYIFTYH